MKTLFAFLVIAFFFTNVQAQEIEATLGGNTSNDGFSVKDNMDSTLFRVRGDGRVFAYGDNVSQLLVGETTAGTNTVVQSTTGYGWVGTLSDNRLSLGANALGIIHLFRVGPDGFVGIGSTDHSNILTIKQNSATDPIADAWTTYSSRRWKKNIKPLEGALDKVMRLQGVSYDWKANGKHDIGLIAEDVGKVIPEVVAYEKNGIDAKSVNYARLVSVLIEAVKDQQKQIEDLKSRINSIVSKESENESLGYIDTNDNNFENVYSVKR